MRLKTLAAAAVVLLGSSAIFTASAFPPSGPHGGPHGGPSGGHHGFGGPHFSFAHHDFGHFTPLERSNWMGGHWDHSWHNGRFGWWWFAGGLWYFYDNPIYPYPGYVSDDYWDDEDDVGPGYQGPSWYYCSAPPGYYPYVQNCGVPWQAVPATPPPPPPGPPPSPPPGYGPPPGSDSGPPPDGPPQQGAYGQGSGDQPPPGYQGPANGPPGELPPPGYGPGGEPPPPPQGGQNGPNGSN